MSKFKPVVFRNAEGDEVRFVEVDNVPGYSHRVFINRKPLAPAHWLRAGAKPSAKAAAYFFEEYGRPAPAKPIDTRPAGSTAGEVEPK